MHRPNDGYLLIMLEGIFNDNLDVRNLLWRLEMVIGYDKLDFIIPVGKSGHGCNVFEETPDKNYV